jgi:hypothetical protein
MEEIWKDIKGYEGIYQVSSFGRVRSMQRIVNNRVLKEKILKPLITKEGYSKYYIYLNNIRTAVRGHRLVAIHFIENPNNFPCVLHKIESVPSNDSIDNLWWGTNDDNIKDKVAKGRQSKGSNNFWFGKKGDMCPLFGRKGINHPNSKIVLNTQTGIFYECVREAAESIGMKYQTLRNKLCGFRFNNTSLIYV